MHPEFYWRRFSEHVRFCPRCQQAGGERAREEDMCVHGRAFVQAWEMAEISWARIRSAQEKYIRGGQRE
jgi:hypothetical protein